MYGYDSQAFILDAKNMGVPQTRRRVFVIARRKDLNLPPLSLAFSEPEIPFIEVRNPQQEGKITPLCLGMWKLRQNGDRSIGAICRRARSKTTMFSIWLVYDEEPCPTLVTNEHILFSFPRELMEDELRKIATFPMDYDTSGIDLRFLVGMCVPPVMTAQIAHQIDKQWFTR